MSNSISSLLKENYIVLENLNETRWRNVFGCDYIGSISFPKSLDKKQEDIISNVRYECKIRFPLFSLHRCLNKLYSKLTYPWGDTYEILSLPKCKAGRLKCTYYLNGNVLGEFSQNTYRLNEWRIKTITKESIITVGTKSLLEYIKEPTVQILVDNSNFGTCYLSDCNSVMPIPLFRDISVTLLESLDEEIISGIIFVFLLQVVFRKFGENY